MLSRVLYWNLKVIQIPSEKFKMTIWSIQYSFWVDFYIGFWSVHTKQRFSLEHMCTLSRFGNIFWFWVRFCSEIWKQKLQHPSEKLKNAFLGQNRHFRVLTTWTTGTLKFDPGVVETFRSRFLKVQGVLFTFLNFWRFVMHFCNPNGILQV